MTPNSCHNECSESMHIFTYFSILPLTPHLFHHLSESRSSSTITQHASRNLTEILPILDSTLHTYAVAPSPPTRPGNTR